MTADILVFLRCPACGHEWHAATIRPDSWSDKGAKPAGVAKICYCVECQQKPPMIVVGEEQQPVLF